MRRDVILEARLSNVRLKSADDIKANMREVISQLESWYLQEYETRSGIKRRVSKARRKAKAREIVSQLEPIDLRDDFVAQAKLLGGIQSEIETDTE